MTIHQLHLQYGFLQAPTVIDDIYQGFPCKRYLYPILTAGMYRCVGLLTVFHDYEYPVVTVYDERTRNHFYKKEWYLKDLMPQIEVFLEKSKF